MRDLTRISFVDWERVQPGQITDFKVGERGILFRITDHRCPVSGSELHNSINNAKR